MEYKRKYPNRERRIDAFVIYHKACLSCGIPKSHSPHKHCRSCAMKLAITDEVKCKMSVTRTGKKMGPMSEEHRQKLKTARIGGRPRWIEDRTKIKVGDRSFNDPLQKQWSLSVKRRDGWKCRLTNPDCFGRLESHHILRWSEFPELRFNINNGITLCSFHHPRKREKEIEMRMLFRELVEEKIYV